MIVMVKTFAVGCAAFTLILTACSGGGDAQPTPSKTAASVTSEQTSASSQATPKSPSLLPPSEEEAPNPVTLLKKIKGCQFDEGESRGQTDAFGNRMADCEVGAATKKGDYYSTGHDFYFMARTNIATPTPAGTETVDDANAIIYGPKWYVAMSGTFGDNLKPADVQKFAKQLGGKVANDASEVGYNG